MLLALAGCAGPDSFESKLQERASDSDTFQLPPETDDGRHWQELLVMCPYDTEPEDVHPALSEAAAELDVSAEGSQWLLLRDDDEVATLTLSRSEVDFCAQPPPESVTYSPESRWEPEPRQGAATAVVPAE
ncbi:MAG: hypothetical protein GX960_12480 [Actinomycetales bacterium]|nr:hypothetical protein [Actinomycetales bacterium]